MSFSCHRHGWYSKDYPCPACVTTVTTSTGLPEQQALKEYPIEDKGELVKIITKAIQDTFNQVHYSHLHPDTFKAMTDEVWLEEWLNKNKNLLAASGSPAMDEKGWIRVEDIMKKLNDYLSCVYSNDQFLMNEIEGCLAEYLNPPAPKEAEK